MTGLIRKPTFIVIGAAKAGSTSIHYYLRKHPEVLVPEFKPIDFFSREAQWNKGLDWYLSLFETNNTNVRAYGEVSTSYTSCPVLKNVAKRMHTALPNIKLIYLVRDPIERLISNYMEVVSAGEENRTFNDILKDLSDNNPLICMSKYHLQLSQYLEYYSKENILILDYKELLNNREACLKSLFAWIDVDDSFWCDEFEKEKNISSKKLKRNLIAKLISPVRLRRSRKIPFWFKEGLLDIASLFAPRLERPVLGTEQEGRLMNVFKDDVKKFKELIDFEPQGWRLYS